MSGDGSVVESAAPTSTADIAANVIEQSEPIGEETTSETPAASTQDAPAVVEPAPSAAAQFLLKQGHQPKKVDGRPVWLPYGTVEKMLDRYVGEHRSAWDGEKKTLSEQLKDYEDAKAALAEQRTLITGDPKHYLSQLAEVDPRYRSFLEPPKTEPASQPLALPDPDVTLQDGSRTFSMEAFQKSIIPFIVEQAKKEAKAEAENALKPLKDREERDEFERGLRERTQATMADVQTWPGWKENHDAILAVLQKDSEEKRPEIERAHKEGRRPRVQFMSVEAAYRQVVIPKLAGDRNKIREEVMKELDTAAKAGPAVARSGAEATKTTPIETRDIAARVIDRLEQGA